MLLLMAKVNKPRCWAKTAQSEKVIKQKNKPVGAEGREQWAKGSHRGSLEGEEEAGRSGQVDSVIITAARAA